MRLAHPAGEALPGPFPAAAWLGTLIAIGPLQGGGRRPDQPGVDRAPLPGRGLLDRGLELLGQAYVDPRGRAVLGDRAARSPARRRPSPRRPRSASSSGSAGGEVTTKFGSRPRSRSSTDPGARSRVISSAAADSASSSVIRIADSSDPVRRSTSARDSSPPASASVANSRPRLLTYEVKSMVPSGTRMAHASHIGSESVMFGATWHFAGLASTRRRLERQPNGCILSRMDDVFKALADPSRRELARSALCPQTDRP